MKYNIRNLGILIINLPANCKLKITHSLSLASDILWLFLQFNHDSAFVWLKLVVVEVVIVSGIHQQLFLSVVLLDLIDKKRSCLKSQIICIHIINLKCFFIYL